MITFLSSFYTNQATKQRMKLAINQRSACVANKYPLLLKESHSASGTGIFAFVSGNFIARIPKSVPSG